MTKTLTPEETPERCNTRQHTLCVMCKRRTLYLEHGVLRQVLSNDLHQEIYAQEVAGLKGFGSDPTQAERMCNNS